MKISVILFVILTTTFFGFGQETDRKNALHLDIGISNLMRQDIIFSPFIHNDLSLFHFGLDYSREAKFLQVVSLRYSNFNPMVSGPFIFYFHGDPHKAYPHSFNLVNLDYGFARNFYEKQQTTLAAGVLFSSDIQSMNYIFGRISSFGYFATFGLGVFGSCERQITSESRIAATVKMPLVYWLARSPYLVNDDAFIENISSHSGLQTFADLIGDGQLANPGNMQMFDFELKYIYHPGGRWDLGMGYLLEYIHMSEPRYLLSLQNSINITVSFAF